MPLAGSAVFRGLQGCWCRGMTEKRQGISARWEESGKSGAVFLPSRGSVLDLADNQKHLPHGRYFAFGELLGKAPQVTKGACSWLGPSCVGVPSLRSRSVGPRRTDIHVLTALSPHPCGSAHSARPPFSLHPSRDWRCLDFLCTKIKSKSRSKASRLKPVLRTACAAVSGTGFSREEASAGDCYFADQTPYLWERACSRMPLLLPLPLPLPLPCC